MDVVVQPEEMLTVVQNGQVMKVHNASTHPITFSAMFMEVLGDDKNGSGGVLHFVTAATSRYEQPEGKE